MSKEKELLQDEETTESVETPFSDFADLLAQNFGELKDYQIQTEKSLDAANRAKKSAQLMKGKSSRFDKKNMIEELQSVDLDIANAIVNQAEAQKVSFEIQSNLVEIFESMLKMSITNLAQSRTIVRELELRLQNVSKDKLDSLAKDELAKLIQQLKDQQDVMRKIERVENRQTYLLTKQRTLLDKHLQLEKNVAEMVKSDKDLSEKVGMNEIAISDVITQIGQLSSEIGEINKKYSEVRQRLEVEVDRLSRYEEIVSEQKNLINKMSNEIDSLNRLNSDLVSITKKVFLYFMIGFGIAVIITIIQFVLKIVV